MANETLSVGHSTVPKYGKSSTYLFNLDSERLTWLSDKVNRSGGQMQFLFQLVHGGYEKPNRAELGKMEAFAMILDDLTRGR